MKLSRRSLLKGAAVAGASAAATAVPVSAKTVAEAPPDAVGMLYDATECIGCKACVSACRKANNLPYEASTTLHDAPAQLSASTKNIIKVYQGEGDQFSFMKEQCMHCVDPACVSACMIGAFKKREFGIVTWDGDRCIGCRYCGIACPYNIPKFEWAETVPKIVKCEMCNHLIAEGGEPACCDVCPKEAVKYGDYRKLLQEAKQRLVDNPDRYEPEVFGETSGGGTQVLYLAPKGISFQDLGLPDLDESPVPDLARSLQHGIYQGFATPAVLYAMLGVVLWRNRKKGQEEES